MVEIRLLGMPFSKKKERRAERSRAAAGPAATSSEIAQLRRRIALYRRIIERYRRRQKQRR